MTALPSIVKRKLATLIPLLRSPVDGEVLATIAGIIRILESAGHDLHDLATVIAGIPTIGCRVTPQPWQATAQWCLHNGGLQLRAAERDFLTSMLHWPTEPSERQARWLDAIHSSLGGSQSAAA